MRDMAAAGTRNVRVSFEKNTPTTDSAGQSVEAWTHQLYRWATVIPRGGSERWLFEQMRAEIDHILHIDWDQAAAAIVPATWRAKIQAGTSTRTLNVDAIFDPDGTRKSLRIFATEVLP